MLCLTEPLMQLQTLVLIYVLWALKLNWSVTLITGVRLNAKPFFLETDKKKYEMSLQHFHRRRYLFLLYNYQNGILFKHHALCKMSSPFLIRGSDCNHIHSPIIWIKVNNTLEKCHFHLLYNMVITNSDRPGQVWQVQHEQPPMLLLWRISEAH